jgi:hypothetical protein
VPDIVEEDGLVRIDAEDVECELEEPGIGFPARSSYQPYPLEGAKGGRTATPRRSSQYTHQTTPSSSRSPYPSLLPPPPGRPPSALREARKSRWHGRESWRCAALV